MNASDVLVFTEGKKETQTVLTGTFTWQLGTLQIGTSLLEPFTSIFFQTFSLNLALWNQPFGALVWTSSWNLYRKHFTGTVFIWNCVLSDRFLQSSVGCLCWNFGLGIEPFSQPYSPGLSAPNHRNPTLAKTPSFKTPALPRLLPLFAIQRVHWRQWQCWCWPHSSDHFAGPGWRGRPRRCWGMRPLKKFNDPISKQPTKGSNYLLKQTGINQSNNICQMWRKLTHPAIIFVLKQCKPNTFSKPRPLLQNLTPTWIVGQNWPKLKKGRMTSSHRIFWGHAVFRIFV